MKTEDKENDEAAFVLGKVYPQYAPMGENSEEDLVAIDFCNKVIRKVYNTREEQFLPSISPKKGKYLKGVSVLDSEIGYIFMEHDPNLDGAFSLDKKEL